MMAVRRIPAIVYLFFGVVLVGMLTVEIFRRTHPQLNPEEQAADFESCMVKNFRTTAVSQALGDGFEYRSGSDTGYVFLDWERHFNIRFAKSGDPAHIAKIALKALGEGAILEKRPHGYLARNWKTTLIYDAKKREYHFYCNYLPPKWSCVSENRSQLPLEIR